MRAKIQLVKNRKVVASYEGVYESDAFDANMTAAYEQFRDDCDKIIITKIKEPAP